MATMLTPAQIDSLIVAAAAKHEVPVSWVRAFCRQESQLDPDAKVTTGTDGARGGAYGLCQLTYRTAQGLGFRGAPDELLDPATNLDWACKLIAELRLSSHGSLKDVAARYNSGMRYESAKWVADNAIDEKRAARFKHTVDVYVPNVLRFEREEAAKETEVAEATKE